MQSKEEIRRQKFLMIESWQQSGLSQKGWCSQENISYHIFHYWYKRYRAARLPDENQKFIALQVEPSAETTCAHVELLLCDGRRLLFHSPVSSDYIKAIIL